MPVVPHQMSGEFDQDGEQGVALETRTKTKRPPLYKVLLLNCLLYTSDAADE